MAIPRSDTRKPARLPIAPSFFWDWAGWSYNPSTETPQQGRLRNARALAAAEQTASERGWFCHWSPDPDADSRDFKPRARRYGLWQCVLYDDAAVRLASLYAVDFGPGGEPWGDPHRRVVEAELAQEALA